MPTSLPQINALIRRDVSPLLELVRYDGYHYFIYDDKAAGRYETQSIHIKYTSHQTVDQWLDDARATLADLEQVFADRDAFKPAGKSLVQDAKDAPEEATERFKDAVRPKEVFTLLRYSDGSGPRLKVSEGYTMQDGCRTVHIDGIGEGVSIDVADIDHLIAGLTAAKRHFEMED